MDSISKINSNSVIQQNIKAETPEELKTKEAAKQFESLLLHQMLTAMSANTGSDDLLGGGREQEFSKDMYNQALAESISEGRGIGIKDLLLRENSRKTGMLAYDKSTKQ